jgi:hypothetical protein
MEGLASNTNRRITRAGTKRSPETATREDIHLFQLHFAETGMSVSNPQPHHDRSLRFRVAATTDRSPQALSGVDRRHHASRELTKPHIGLEILPRRRFGFPLRDRLMRSSTVVCATFSTRAIARMRNPF